MKRDQSPTLDSMIRPKSGRYRSSWHTWFVGHRLIVLATEVVALGPTVQQALSALCKTARFDLEALSHYHVVRQAGRSAGPPDTMAWMKHMVAFRFLGQASMSRTSLTTRG